MEKNYWGYRVDKSCSKFFAEEIEKGKLRQGWGWDEGQNLRNMTLNEGASRNYPIYRKVKKGDILLIMHVPHYGIISIVEAVDDFETGYRFEIANNGDYGHIFPVKKIKEFSKQNKTVLAGLQTTFKCKSRFWNTNHCHNNIEALINDSSQLLGSSTYIERLESSVRNVFENEQDKLQKRISEILNNTFHAETWEFALVEILQKLYPSYVVERCGGVNEINHGSDILVKIPSVGLDEDYIIAIQVKDYKGNVGKYPVNQIVKAHDYWLSKDNKGMLIELVVILIGAEKTDCNELEEYAKDKKVRIMYKKDIDSLMLKYAMNFISDEI